MVDEDVWVVNTTGMDGTQTYKIETVSHRIANGALQFLKLLTR